MCLKFLHCTHIVLKIRYFNCNILSSELKQLNTRARYKRRGALGTPGSFVNQPSWHTELQNGLSCSGCKALTRGAFLGKSGKSGVISIRHSEVDKIFFFSLPVCWIMYRCCKGKLTVHHFWVRKNEILFILSTYSTTCKIIINTTNWVQMERNWVELHEFE